jgi:anthranilate phosphoribosyltransferase
MLSELLNKLIARQDLAQAEAAALLEAILADDATDSRIAAALVALASKGETEEELAGFAQTMRARCSRIASKHSRYVDTCGTGGSRAKTFNVSTAAAFVVAAAGVPVAKHGNVGVTTRAGSADVLGALGVKVDLAPERVNEIFDEIGVCFMFAPLHHAATKRVAMVRRDLGVRTIFNLLGPLTNPAGAPFQVAGVSSEGACEKVARALARLGTRRAWVVRGEDGLDEITLAGKTVVHSASPEGPKVIDRFEIVPEDFGLRRASIDHLRGGSAEENAAIIRDVLEGRRKDEARDLVLINAAASLFIAGAADSFVGAVGMAARSIETGGALAKLHALRQISQSTS